jgi:integrating conjugative element protein (TIGR03757 family)
MRARLAGALLALACAHVGAADPRIEVFTVSGLPVSAPPGVSVYPLDALRKIEAELSAGLPSDPDQAMRVAQQRIQERALAFKDQVTAAGIGAGLALRYGIERVPAIVFDGRSVVYGEVSVERALAQWRHARLAEATR